MLSLLCLVLELCVDELYVSRIIVLQCRKVEMNPHLPMLMPMQQSEDSEWAKWLVCMCLFSQISFWLGERLLFFLKTHTLRKWTLQCGVDINLVIYLQKLTFQFKFHIFVVLLQSNFSSEKYHLS